MTNEKNNNRLFVPLSSNPYLWFQSGLKKWELRKYGRQYTEKHVYVGRRIELRRGYSDKVNTFWGTIVLVERANDLSDFFDKVDYREVMPMASSKEDAIFQAGKILNIQIVRTQELIGFKVQIDNQSI